MSTTFKTLASTLLMSIFFLGSMGCGVKELANCRTICSKKRDCDNNTYNVDNCTKYCSDIAERDSEYARKVDTCKECVAPLSCGDYKIATCLVNCPNLP